MTDENGPQKKKVKAGADGKPAVPKKSPGKAPGTGSSKKPPGPKKEKAAGGGGASTPKPPSKKKKVGVTHRNWRWWGDALMLTNALELP